MTPYNKLRKSNCTPKARVFLVLVHLSFDSNQSNCTPKARVFLVLAHLLFDSNQSNCTPKARVFLFLFIRYLIQIRVSILFHFRKMEYVCQQNYSMELERFINLR